MPYECSTPCNPELKFFCLHLQTGDYFNYLTDRSQNRVVSTSIIKKMQLFLLHKDHWFSTYAKLPEKLTFLTPWYVHVCAYRTPIVECLFGISNLHLSWLLLWRLEEHFLWCFRNFHSDEWFMWLTIPPLFLYFRPMFHWRINQVVGFF